MIRLTRSTPPSVLSPDLVKELTERFKSTGDSVWDIQDLKDALTASSRGKCAYCECALGEESKYMEVEHFRDKKTYPDEVLSWENLLPSCKRCNASKGGHDVLAQPIVNPYIDEPRHHIAFSLYRLRDVSPLGKATIGVMNLNDTDRAVFKRFEIGEMVNELVERAWDRFEMYELQSSTIRRNALLRAVRGLLVESQATAAYAATSATVLHSSAVYMEIRQRMQQRNLWDEDMENLHAQSLQFVL